MEDRDRILLGIKYEAAIVGGLEGDALVRIEEQVASEAGGGWREDPLVLRGRNAVRAEHGLPSIGQSAPPPREVPAKPLWRRLFGR